MPVGTSSAVAIEPFEPVEQPDEVLIQQVLGGNTIPNNPTRKHLYPFDPEAYKLRNLIERMFCRLKHWRRIATRYDKLASNFAAAVMLAAVVIWWV